MRGALLYWPCAGDETAAQSPSEIMANKFFTGLAARHEAHEAIERDFAGALRQQNQ
jgi:hypothetical protein